MVNTPTHSVAQRLEVVPFEPRFREDFRRLNLEWIEKLFVLEPSDAAILADPEGQVVARGGQVLFLLEDGWPVGTCALVPHGEGELELAKMAVTESSRGRGYGRRLLAAAIDEARRLGARRVVLFTNSKLAAAIHLYKSAGFGPTCDSTASCRCDVSMALEL